MSYRVNPPVVGDWPSRAWNEVAIEVDCSDMNAPQRPDQESGRYRLGFRTASQSARLRWVLWTSGISSASKIPPFWSSCETLRLRWYIARAARHASSAG